MNMIMNRMEKLSLKKVMLTVLMAALVFVVLAPFSANQANAALPNGTYQLPYTVYKDGTTQPSYMDTNGYVKKPATLIVTNGQYKVRVAITKSAWVTEFKTQQNGQYVNATVVSTSGDTRIVEFPVTSSSQKLNVKLHVSVPKEYTGGIPYDHDYVVQFQFDDSDI
ncbi:MULTISPECIES: NEAT domain-containing protein [Paenibacillus]|uniref:NEAT domain-containing protein n=1 Tax=Paenibacillus TaxID=44249 RepID=UPI00058A3E03|nr:MULTISPECIES: NEAT domain-containing protein [Paenibacillus]MCV9951351.1 NEAT domain-containing protein [Paenibacillus sp. BT-177]AJE52438.1 cell surface protein [Paenibacillus polymyxa]MBU9708829.1 NEAT domain-containing protein [Paenibacillus sp. AK121]MEE4568668.1 NEAT domain-containing protein [Paenibacillus polymyxa]QOH63738.1 cell surface protein [Paenibacillus polymyxa]